jgi:hypothetical protein
MAVQPDAGAGVIGQPGNQLADQDGTVCVPRRDLMQVLNAIAWNGRAASGLSSVTLAAVGRLQDIAREAPETAS